MAEQVVGRTQAERRSKSEEALLDAAAVLIGERGVERASLASIGSKAGASRGLPTHHFGSKDALIARLAARTQDRISAAMLESLERAGRRRDDVTALELVRLAADRYLEMFEQPTADQRALIVMWGSTFPSRASVEGMTEADRRSYEGWAEVIEQGQREGSIRADLDPRAAAVVLAGLLRGIAALLLTDAEVTDMRSVRQTCQDWIDGALSPTPTLAGVSSPGNGKGPIRTTRTTGG